MGSAYEHETKTLREVQKDGQSVLERNKNASRRKVGNDQDFHLLTGKITLCEAVQERG
jgi:hypothetical protein